MKKTTQNKFQIFNKNNEEILMQKPMKIFIYDTLFVRWFRDNIFGDRIIFRKVDIVNFNDECLRNMIKSEQITGEISDIVIDRTDNKFVIAEFHFDKLFFF